MPAKPSVPGKSSGAGGSDARTFYKIGNEHYEKGDFDKAIENYDKAIELNPEYEKAYYNRGLAFACKEDYDKAIVDIKKVIEIKPNFAEAYYILGLAYEYKQLPDKAIEAYNKALKLNPNFKDAKSRLELTMSKKEKMAKAGGAGAPAGGAPGKAKAGQTKTEDGQLKEVAFLEKPKLNFTNVAGMEHMKETIKKFIVYPFKDPELAKKYGMQAGGGVLLYGPPGCGKTFVAKATAGECTANFLNAKISDMVDMYAGNTEKNIHKVFETARQNSPAIVFMDEMEALGGKREGDSQQHMKMAVNQLLAEMDGVEGTTENILVMGATNMPWEVDPALRRSGRFGSMIYIPPPDHKSRVAILKLECKNRPISGINFSRLGRATIGYSAADMKQIVKEASMIPWEQEFKTGKGRDINMGDFLSVIKKRKSTLPPWYELVSKEIVGKKEKQIIDGKEHVTEKPSKLSPEERELYKDLIKEIEKGNKWYWQWAKKVWRWIAIYIPIPFF